MDEASSTQPIGNDEPSDTVASYRDPLNFKLDDKTFLEYAKQLKKDADTEWETKGPDGLTLKQRRNRNLTYLFGQQYAGLKRKKYNSTAQDNILWEASKYLRAMATSKLPDITITPGSDTDIAKQMAEELSRVTTTDLQKRERKRVLGQAFEHIPPYMCGIIKPFWNPQKGKYGNYDFRVVHPDLCTLDPKAATNDVRDMGFFFEEVEYSVKELCMMFPTKKEELFKELRRLGKFGNVGEEGKPNETQQKGMNSKVKITEVWFKWYDQPTDDKKEWEQIVGVGWYFGELLFDKMKHPYWDWTGEPQTFKVTFKDLGDNKYSKEKSPVDESELMNSMATGQQIPDSETDTIFRNHLEYPEFPYIVLGGNQWGDSPIDKTSSLEQAVSVQENYDKRSRQEDEIIDRSRGKHVFSTAEGLDKDDITNMDLNDPDQDVLIKGDVNKAHNFIPGEQPTPALIQDKTESRERIFDKMGVHPATRGQMDKQGAAPATNNQLSREGDFTRMDDYVDDTINYAAEKMGNWQMQFIKLFYTENHLRRILGPDGQWMTVQLHRDMLDDGMEVIISASGSDKLKAEQRAMDMAKMKLIDPFRFYKDIGASDPRGRAIALGTFLMQPDLYFMDVKAGGDGSGQKGLQSSANIVNGSPAQPGQQPGQPPQLGQDPNQPQGAPTDQSPQAQQDIMQIEQGQIPPVPQQIDPAYAATFNAFMQSPQVEQLIQQYGDQFKGQLIQFAQAITQLSQQPQQGVGQPQQPQQQPGQMPTPPGEQFGQAGSNATQTVGPLSQNPSPQNPSRISAIAGR